LAEHITDQADITQQPGICAIFFLKNHLTHLSTL